MLLQNSTITMAGLLKYGAEKNKGPKREDVTGG